MEVTTFDLCPKCNTLQKEVKKREWSNYSYVDPKKIDMVSCQSCFDLEVLKKKNEKTSGYTGWGIFYTDPD